MSGDTAQVAGMMIVSGSGLDRGVEGPGTGTSQTRASAITTPVTARREQAIRQFLVSGRPGAAGQGTAAGTVGAAALYGIVRPSLALDQREPRRHHQDHHEQHE